VVRLVSSSERIGRLTLTVTGYLFGIGRLMAIWLPAFAGARAWRRLIAPHWSGTLATLADLVGAVSGVIALSELLGSVGLFRRGPMIVADVALGLGSRWWCSRHAGGKAGSVELAAAPSVPLAVSDVIVASASTALVVAQWSTWVSRGLSFGIGNSGGPGNGDTLWYHMPFAAAFVQTGWTSHLQFLNGEALVTYYPANTSVLHAVGILSMGTDVLSLFVNLALVPIALLAGWCIGARGGVGPASLAGVAVALTIPVVVVSEAATAKDDLLGIVGLLGCIAFVVHASRDATGKTAIYAGLSAGLAAGSKLTFVAPIIAVAVCLAVVTPSGARRTTMTRWAVAAFCTGGYWYLRNLLTVGNPLPGLGLGLGNLHLPRPPTPSMDDFGTNVLHNLSNGRVWHEALLPGLRTGFGAAWPVIVGIVAAALALGVVRLHGRELVAPVVGVAAVGAFVVTPGTVWAPQLIANPGVRFVTANLFAFNLRYMLPAVAIGLVILPLVARRWRHGPLVATAALGVALAAIQLSPQSRQSWSAHQIPVALAAGVFTALTMVWLTAKRPTLASLTRVPRPVTVCSVALIAIALGWPVLRTYDRHRYLTLDLARWADTLPGAHIGFSGFVFSYPLYGAHLQNHVEMIGQHGPDGAWHPVPTCQDWRRAVRHAGVHYLVVPNGPPAVGLGIDLSRWRVGLAGGEPPDTPPESAWTRTDPGTHVVFRSSEGAVVYTVAGPATTRGCT
jgi:hypothetical protein